MAKTFLILAAFFFSCTANAQLAKADIKDLAFISGRWVLSHEWGEMEENWSAPQGNNMMCSYRCVKDGKAVFYEFMLIEQSDSVPVLKLRHFNPGSIGWEEKDKPLEYPLVSLKKSEAFFGNASLKMGFIRRSPTALSVTLEEQEKDGKWVKMSFDYQLGK
ncbi:MAG: hypothetical protein EOO09_12355 [Chitinophagaceae bacterium]|nr:MAG: hypothetical protein EOO09_12355 [Chitinophagaceae bacterium]